MVLPGLPTLGGDLGSCRSGGGGDGPVGEEGDEDARAGRGGKRGARGRVDDERPRKTCAEKVQEPPVRLRRD